MAFLVLPSKIAPGRVCAAGLSFSLTDQGIGMGTELCLAGASCASAFLMAALPAPSAPFKRPFVWSFIPRSLLISRCLRWADGVMSLFSHPVCGCAPHLFLLTLISAPPHPELLLRGGSERKTCLFPSEQTLSSSPVGVSCADQAGLAPAGR